MEKIFQGEHSDSHQKERNKKTHYLYYTPGAILHIGWKFSFCFLIDWGHELVYWGYTNMASVILVLYRHPFVTWFCSFSQEVKSISWPSEFGLNLKFASSVKCSGKSCCACPEPRPRRTGIFVLYLLGSCPTVLWTSWASTLEGERPRTSETSLLSWAMWVQSAPRGPSCWTKMHKYRRWDQRNHPPEPKPKH